MTHQYIYLAQEVFASEQTKKKVTTGTGKKINAPALGNRLEILKTKLIQTFFAYWVIYLHRERLNSEFFSI